MEKDKTIAAVKELISKADILSPTGTSARVSRSRSRRSAALIDSCSESDLQSVSDKSEPFYTARSRVQSEPRLPMSPVRSRPVVPHVLSEPRVNTARSSVSMDRERDPVDSVPSYFRKVCVISVKINSTPNYSSIYLN